VSSLTRGGKSARGEFSSSARRVVFVNEQFSGEDDETLRDETLKHANEKGNIPTNPRYSEGTRISLRNVALAKIQSPRLRD